MRFLVYWLPVYVYAIIIFYLSSMTPVDLPPIVFSDKIVHMIEYFLFALLLIRAMFHSCPYVFRSSPFLMTFVLGTLYAFSDEIHQYFVPGRVFSYHDLLADIIGIVLAIVMCWSIKRWIQLKK